MRTCSFAVIMIVGAACAGCALTNERDAASESEVERGVEGTCDTGQTSMTARFHHSAIRLDNGDVLVAGGKTANGTYTNVSEIYNVASGKWYATGALNTARAFAQIIRMQDGRIMLAGGTGTKCMKSAEIFDPATNQWSYTGNEMNYAYFDAHTKNGQIALLRDGRVLMAGGFAGGCAPNYNRATAIYDPATNMWSAGPNLNYGRRGSKLVTLKDGRVFMSLGYGSTNPSTRIAEVYDPEANTWTLTPAWSTTGAFTNESNAVLMDDGRVYVFGGDNGGCGALLTAYYNYTTNTWAAGQVAMSCFYGNPYVVDQDGRIIAFGRQTGFISNAVSIYDPLTATWSSGPPSQASLHGQDATLLNDGHILLTGGTADGQTPSSNAQLY